MASRQVMLTRRHKLSALVAIGAGAFLAVYLFVVTLIGAGVEDQVTPPQPPADGVSLTLVQNRVKATEPWVVVLVVVLPDESLVDDDGQLIDELTVFVDPTLDAELTFEAGRRPRAREVRIPLAGSVENYPFDEYRAMVAVSAALVVGGRQESIPVSVGTALRDPGWASDTVIAEAEPDVFLDMTLSRANSTQAISIMLLGFMVALALVAALVAIWIVAGMLEAQVGVASWLAALLFAMIPLRTFLPGAPPVGSWIDILVFFWVEMVVMLGMLMVVVTLLVRSRGHAEPVAAVREADDEPDAATEIGVASAPAP